MNQANWDSLSRELTSLSRTSSWLSGALGDLKNHICDLDVKNQALTKANEALAKQARHAVGLYSALGILVATTKETLEGANTDYLKEKIEECEQALKRFSDGVVPERNTALAKTLDSIYEHVRFSQLLCPLKYKESTMYPLDNEDIQYLVEIAKKYQKLVGAEL